MREHSAAICVHMCVAFRGDLSGIDLAKPEASREDGSAAKKN